MLSGYRDGKNMQLCIEHNYSKWYAEHDITLDSEPKSAMDFRKVIMLDQIEVFRCSIRQAPARWQCVNKNGALSQQGAGINRDER